MLKDNIIQLERENKIIETNVSNLLSSYKKYYELVQEEKRLIIESTNGKINGIQKMYIQSQEKNNGLSAQIKELNGKITELEKMQEFSMVQHAEECQLAEEKINKMQHEVKSLGSEKVELEKTNSELQEKVKHLTEASAEAESHVVCINLILFCPSLSLLFDLYRTSMVSLFFFALLRIGMAMLFTFAIILCSINYCKRFQIWNWILTKIKTRYALC